MAGPMDDQPEAPLDPAIARVQARLRTMMLIAAGTLGIGLIAVFVAIAFRVARSGEDAAPAGGPFQTLVEVVTPGTIVGTDVTADRLSLTIDGPEGKVVEIHHLPSGKLIGRAVLLAK
ncbi:MAG: hypothetical protein H6Q99_2444 [Proteobacteria bacterium]|nr:hypothetical protein [Pseudomonadota bacterium]